MAEETKIKTNLGKVMLINGGEYDPNAVYNEKTFVLFQNSTYLALQTVTGVEPSDDRVNWQLMAKGFVEAGSDVKEQLDQLEYQVERMDNVVPVTLAADGWIGTAAPYTQTVIVDGITADDNPLLVRTPPEAATEAQQKAYNKAFGIISEGTGETGNGIAIFTVYKKPETNIVVGLRGVGGGAEGGIS